MKPQFHLIHLHLQQVASPRLFLKQMICTWHKPTTLLENSQTSHFCIDLGKIVLWSSFYRQLVPRFENDQGTFLYISFNWLPSPDYQIIGQKTKAGCINLLNNLLSWNLNSYYYLYSGELGKHGKNRFLWHVANRCWLEQVVIKL